MEREHYLRAAEYIEFVSPVHHHSLNVYNNLQREYSIHSPFASSSQGVKNKMNGQLHQEHSASEDEERVKLVANNYNSQNENETEYSDKDNKSMLPYVTYLNQTTPLQRALHNVHNALQPRQGIAVKKPLTLVPPFRFASVEHGIYRGAYPTLRNLPFLYDRHIKTIVSFTPETLTYDVESFASFMEIELVHIQAERFKGEAQLLPMNITQALEVLLDLDKHPVYLHCLDGRHVSGLVILALRKLQNWDMKLAHDEYLRFTKESQDEMSFISEYNGPIKLPCRIPSWLSHVSWQIENILTPYHNKTNNNNNNNNYCTLNANVCVVNGIKIKINDIQELKAKHTASHEGRTVTSAATTKAYLSHSPLMYSESESVISNKDNNENLPQHETFHLRKHDSESNNNNNTDQDNDIKDNRQNKKSENKLVNHEHEINENVDNSSITENTTREIIDKTQNSLTNNLKGNIINEEKMKNQSTLISKSQKVKYIDLDELPLMLSSAISNSTLSLPPSSSFSQFNTKEGVPLNDNTNTNINSSNNSNSKNSSSKQSVVRIKTEPQNAILSLGSTKNGFMDENRLYLESANTPSVLSKPKKANQRKRTMSL